MGIMSIRINEDKRKMLKVIASIEGKTMSTIMSELIDEYVKRNRKKILELSEREKLKEIMELSETAFADWDNEEDEIYNNL